MNYLIHLLIYFSIYGILAMSLNLAVGYCGLMTLAHAAYFAVGAYIFALFSASGHSDFMLIAACAMGLSMLLSLAVSLPAWRFKGDLFVMMSLAVQALFMSIFQNWVSSDAPLGSLKNMTNGPFGVAGISRPTLFGWKCSTLPTYLLLSFLTLAVASFIVWRLVHSPWGRLLRCMRDDELAARSLGKNTRKAKVEAFAFSCGLAALAGCLYAGYVGYVDPSSASLDESILMLCMVLVGGVGNFRGPLIGAAILIALPEILRFTHFPDAIAANMRLLIYGLLLILIAHFRPQGVAGDYRLE